MDNVVHKAFVVREASTEDAGAILACLGAAFAAYRAQYTCEAFAQTVLDPDAIQNRIAIMQLFVAVSKEEGIVGTIGCETKGHDGHLRGMAVLPEWQGVGVAAALLWTAEVALRMLGCRRVILGTTEPLKRAINFYQRHGFSPSGHVSDFFGMRLYEYTKPIGRDVIRF